jgi:hypothetical protein
MKRALENNLMSRNPPVLELGKLFTNYYNLVEGS